MAPTRQASRTRLLRFDPGVYTTAPFVHDHWEEVYLISGDLIVGNDRRGEGGKHSRLRPMRAARPEFITAPSSQKPAACCSKFITTTTGRIKRPMRFAEAANLAPRDHRPVSLDLQ